MKAPIIVISDDVELFASVEKAERYVEPVDAPNCTFLDAEGWPLRYSVTERFLGEVVKLERTPDANRDVEALKEALLWFVSGRDRVEKSVLAGLSTEQLLERAQRHVIS